MTDLFSPFELKDITLRNRVAVPAMCQYQAVNGYTNEWHSAHYAGLARGGAGLVIVEATGVSPEGRITPGCTGLWEDGQIAGMAAIAQSIKSAGAVPGIQIAHAGRKASANLPWQGDDHIDDPELGGWDTISPSAIAFGGNLPKVPKAMTLADIQRVQQDFVAAAKRALAAGFEWLELHFAHGYLAQSFMSVHANSRTDEYGGSLGNRARFLIETLAAVRKVWPENLPLTARFGVIEYDGQDEETIEDAISVVNDMKAGGLDLLNASIGFSTIESKTPWGPSFFVPVARRVRNQVTIPVAAAWCIDDPVQANEAVRGESLDLVMIGRAHLANPHYTYELAQVLDYKNPAKMTLPPSYSYWLSRYKGPGRGAAQ